MQHLPWTDVALFLAIARTGALRAAAEETGLDVSTLSRRLVALEEQLGASLFDRTRAGMTPTPLARALVEPAEAMERAAHAFVRTREGFERDVAGEVRLSVTPSVGDLFLADLLRGLGDAHPRLAVVVDVSNELVDIERRAADLGLRLVRPRRGDLVAQRLARLPHRALARPDLVAELGVVRRWSDVPWALPERGAVARAVEALGAPRIVARTDSIPAQLDLVSAGLAVAVLPTVFQTRRGLSPLRIARALREPTWIMPELWMVGHAAGRRVPRIAAMASWLAARVAAIFGRG